MRPLRAHPPRSWYDRSKDFVNAQVSRETFFQSGILIQARGITLGLLGCHGGS